MIVSFVFVPVYIHFLGVVGYGVYSFLMMFFGWITILHAGMDPAVTKMTAQYVAESNTSRINPLIAAALIFQFCVASIIAGAVMVAGHSLAAFVVKNQVAFLNETRIAVYYAGANIVALMCRNIYIALFMGLQRYDVSGSCDSVSNFLGSIFSLFVLWLGYGIVGMIIVRLIINVLAIGVLHRIARRLVPTFRLTLDISKQLVKEIYGYASWVVTGRINRLVVNALPPILIGKYIGPAGIAYFNISSRLALTVNNLLSSAIIVLFPFVSELKALTATEKIKSAYLGANRILSLVSAPIYCFGAIFSWGLLYLWLGPKIADNCWELTGLFFIGYYLSSCTMVPSSFALGLGAVRIIAINATIQTILIIIVLPWFLKMFGILGAGLNLILFEVPSIVMVTIITKRIINASSLKYWIKDRLLILFVSAIIFAVFIPIKRVLWPAVLTRTEMAAYLSVVFMLGMLSYGFVVRRSSLIDQDTKARIAKLFLKAN